MVIEYIYLFVDFVLGIGENCMLIFRYWRIQFFQDYLYIVLVMDKASNVMYYGGIIEYVRILVRRFLIKRKISYQSWNRGVTFNEYWLIRIIVGRVQYFFWSKNNDGRFVWGLFVLFGVCSRCVVFSQSIGIVFICEVFFIC